MNTNHRLDGLTETYQERYPALQGVLRKLQNFRMVACDVNLYRVDTLLLVISSISFSSPVTLKQD